MRKLFTTLLSSLAICIVSHAQIYIQSTLPVVGLVQKNQLWNLVLINGTSAAIDGKMDLVLRDRQTGLELLTATTSRFTLTKGSMTLNVNNLNPIQYNYLSMDPAAALNGLLPAGAYTICYSFTRTIGDKHELLAEECVPFDIEPLSPPMLIYPADSAELDALPTQFTWTPPNPAGMINHLRYEVLIAEIKQGQQAAEALQDNASFYNTADVPNNFLTYPATLPAFEKEKWYGWQVVARDNKNYAGKSEVWTFKVKNPAPSDIFVLGAPYIRMKTGEPEQGIAPNGILKLVYFNRTVDSLARITLYDLSANNEGANAPSITVKIIAGENQLQVNLKRIINVTEENIYKAEITSSSGERNSVLFRVKYFRDK